MIVVVVVEGEKRGCVAQWAEAVKVELVVMDKRRETFLPAKPAVRCIVRLSGTPGSFGLMVECDPFGYEGFISIDCGIVEGSTNNDATTNINYRSDGSSMDMGMHVNICSNLMLQTLPQRLLNVKSFPEGDGNCYALVPERGKGNKYLIRASFVYGNKCWKQHICYSRKLHDLPPIIHRDVKTKNIALTEQSQAKVADFGLSRILTFESRSHPSTAVVGAYNRLSRP
ncbi:hypothetical protein RHMOL_Rhmol12G0239000 [Rhododendron molle]|uniref:Uncharacterized protein n=1 Tax=Rhododendron molle TaxID=49168 RepID=A0ACC0LN82_RHOML|nr:hypothetical protein RHMOL_Rhmol12G0239000 [Rhododendron molle]